MRENYVANYRYRATLHFYPDRCTQQKDRQRFVRLEHLRFGPNRPVYLFDLAPEDELGVESGRTIAVKIYIRRGLN